MTGHEAPGTDYFEFHQARLQALVGQAEALLAASYHYAMVEKSADEPAARITEGEITGFDMQSYYEHRGIPMSIEDAEEAARIRTQALLAGAQISFLQLRADFTMQFVAKQVEQGLMDENGTPSVLAYESAEKCTVDLTDDLDLAITRLHGLEQIGDVSQYELGFRDGPIKHYLVLEATNNVISDTTSVVKPVEDEDYRRWAEMLGIEAMGDLFIPLTGRFSKEADLHLILNDVWLSFRGTAKEEVVGPLLDEVRIRALAAKSAIEMAARFSPDLSRPSPNTLDAWANILNDI